MIFVLRQESEKGAKAVMSPYMTYLPHLTFIADHYVPLDDSTRKGSWEAVSFLLIAIMVSIVNAKANFVSNSSVTITLFFFE